MLKVLKGEDIIDVLLEPVYVRYQARNHILIQCEESVAQGVLSDNGSTVYQLEDKETLGDGYDTVVLVDISKEEYDTLRSALDMVNEPPTQTPEPQDDSQVLQLVLKAKIKSLSEKCSEIITSGFDIILSDGLRHKFSLSLEDQINMISLQEALNAGETRIAYHGVDEPYQYFSDSDIRQILEKKEHFKNYNLLYFNSLKNYLNSLSTIQEVKNIEWGAEIPVNKQTAAFRAFLSGGSANES